jgi:hypothetical protein
MTALHRRHSADCPNPLTCYPTGHHCPDCGFHDDTACAKHPEPQPGEQPWYLDTLLLPADLFDTLALAERRRNTYRWAIDAPGPMALAVRELAAAVATGSRRLTPMTAYRISQNLAAIHPGSDLDAVDDAPYWAVLDLMTPEQRAQCEAVDEAEQAEALAQYRAWKAQQLEAQGQRVAGRARHRRSRVTAPLACALSWCRKSPARPYPCGPRCDACSPSAQAGVPEPDELLALHRKALATTTERTAAA